MHHDSRNYKTRRQKRYGVPFHFRRYKHILVPSDRIVPGERRTYKKHSTRNYKKGNQYYSQKRFTLDTKK